MPRSPADLRTAERRSVLGKARENPFLIRRHRMLKSLSSGGKVHTLGNCSLLCPNSCIHAVECKCSGKTTQASI